MKKKFNFNTNLLNVMSVINKAGFRFDGGSNKGRMKLLKKQNNLIVTSDMGGIPVKFVDARSFYRTIKIVERTFGYRLFY